MLASENARFVLLIGPAGVSASAKTAVVPAALNVFTVAFKPFTKLVKLVTFEDSPPTVLFTVLSEFVFPETVVPKLLKLAVKLLIELACAVTVVLTAPKELVNDAKLATCVFKEDVSEPTLVFKLDTDAA